MIDLTISSLSAAGLGPPDDLLSQMAADSACGDAWTRYPSSARGCLEARAAVGRFHRPEDPPDPGHIFLTTGTSLSYFALLAVLCNPGDEILVPKPGYPLFDDLGAMASVRVRPYDLILVDHGGTCRWELSPDALEERITRRSRAIVVVSPHNPTGHVASAEDWRGLAAVAERHRLPVIVDEVFRHFPVGADRALPRPEPRMFPVLVSLDGLSKCMSLPGLKAGWMVLEGHAAAEMDRIGSALDHLLDSLLPVGETAQAVLRGVFGDGDLAQRARMYRSWLGRQVGLRVGSWLEATSACGLMVPRPDAGWHLCWPSVDGRGASGLCDLGLGWAAQLLDRTGLLAHYGEWYGLEAGWAVSSGLASIPQVNLTNCGLGLENCLLCFLHKIGASNGK